MSLDEADDFPPITVEEVDAGLMSLAAETGVGAEVLGPREWLRLPRQGRQDLADILNMA